MMDEGKVTGYFCQGFNPVASFPDKKQSGELPEQAEVHGGYRSAGD
ncbi:formate dehydrogenase, nitrate-inducible, major subunit [Escherichia coli]|uniref:Formate dehydrogenase, nitrate-inducible, major subunit n=1 Tax=Escherichia coli TaxID=562 RepID=A0A3S4KJB7_ECOLX|nr:formate dehydrogenase, nitrate-inducible, major subunit [Escherichia coli]